MKLTERRSETRVRLSVPLRFRPVAEPDSAQQLAETVNISQGGLYVSTSFPLQVGAQVEVFMKIPRELSGNASTDVRCLASVVRVTPGSLMGKAGVGMRIERYDPLAAHDRWAS
jgi:hypothetical protein